MNEVKTPQQILTEIVQKVVSYTKVDCQVEISEEMGGNGKTLLASISVPGDANLLIGRNGQNLRALEHLVRVLFARQGGQDYTVTIDINDYRRSRTQQAIEVAKAAVSRVRNTQKAEALLPMSAYERRMVHMELAAYPDVETESIGEEPHRRIVIKPFP